MKNLFRRPPPPAPPALPPVTWYELRHEFGGPSHVFACEPRHVYLALMALHDYGLSDVCREALADAAEAGRLPARYGPFWTLEAIGER